MHKQRPLPLFPQTRHLGKLFLAAHFSLAVVSGSPVPKAAIGKLCQELACTSAAGQSNHTGFCKRVSALQRGLVASSKAMGRTGAVLAVALLLALAACADAGEPKGKRPPPA